MIETRPPIAATAQDLSCDRSPSNAVGSARVSPASPLLCSGDRGAGRSPEKKPAGGRVGSSNAEPTRASGPDSLTQAGRVWGVDQVLDDTIPPILGVLEVLLDG